jgi:uncharacterized protein (TIRG00374 family)
MLSLVLTAGILHALGADNRDLGRAVGVLAHPWPAWIVLALALEVASYLSYALAQHRLVLATGERLSTGWLAALAVSAQALNNFLPAGYLAANILNFRELRRRALSAGQATWLLLTSSVLYIATLATLALIGSAFVGGQDGGMISYLSIGAFVLAATLLVLLWALSRRAAGRRLKAAAASRDGQAPGVLRSRGGQALGSLLSSISQVRLSRGRLAGAVLLFAGCWMLDAACLIASFQAVDAPLPWSGLLAAYCGAQLVSFLPITPGGIGLVEGSLTLGLAASGLGTVHVLSGVLLYRMISYWGTLPVGAAGYLVVRRTRPGSVIERRVGSPEWPAPTVSAAPLST